MKDLTNSSIDRKNILNNNLVIPEVYEQVGFLGLKFDGKYRYTKQQIAKYYEVDSRTIDRLLENHKEELEQSGYEVFSGTKLKEFKEFITKTIHFGNDIHVVTKTEKDDNDIHVVIIREMFENELENLNKTTIIGLFTFKTFLNIGMLLTDSEKARKLRSLLLDIVIDVLNKKIGGKTKYINQREEEFLPSAIREFNYRKEFMDALDLYITSNKFKYSQLTDKIYKSIFKENAKEYRQILKLNSKENVRNTMYSEVLDLVASFENGYTDYLKKNYEKLGRKIYLSDAIQLFSEFENNMESFVQPLREKARSLMASRDFVFRDALHEKLKDYVNAVSTEDFDKFLGEKSMELEKRLEENKDVFKRLKDR
jgi:hypothetical protein